MLVNLSNKQFFEGVNKSQDSENIDNIHIFRNKDNIKLINNYLNNNSSDTKAIILRGTVGCGKITLIKKCIKESGFMPQIYDFDCESDDVFGKLLSSIKIKGMSRFFGIKKILVIRDIDNSLKNSQKMEFFKTISESENVQKIIMTSNSKNVGIIREVPNNILQLDFEKPCIVDLTRTFQTDIISRNALNKLVKDSNFDIRYIKNIIENVKDSSSKKVSVSSIDKYKKDLEQDTFTCIKYCLDSNNNFDDRLNKASYYTNTTIFHNYPNMVNNINNLCEISSYCSFSDVITNYSFSNQDWDNPYDMSCILGTLGPCNIIEKKNANLTYPPNSLINNDTEAPFDKISEEACRLKILIGKFFIKNKFDKTKSIEEFNKEMENIKHLNTSFKLAFCGKQNIALLREIKKYKK